MDAMREFLADWTTRLTAALVAAIDDSVDDFEGSPVYAAAITVADGNTVPALAVSTEANYIELITDAADAMPAELAAFRWWPDEWDFFIDGPEDEIDALSEELSDWVEAHPDAFPDGAWTDEWMAATHEALITALGAPEVRAAFAKVDSDPVLIVADTDDRFDDALDAFEQLNEGRDDGQLDSARTFWQANADDDFGFYEQDDQE